MCYKPYMRKWMREKLNRRKKSTEETKAQPAPLQPAYFEPEAHQPQPEVREAEPPQAQPETPAALASETQSAGTTADVGQQGSGELRRPRRRRGRGGRGRKGPASQPAKASTGADVAPAMPMAATIPPAPQGQRPSKGVVVLAVGLPGSGKSSWFKRHNINPLSSDVLRSMLFDDPAEQRFQDLVFSNLRSMLKARLIARRPTNYVDATNLTPQERQSWTKLAKDFGYDVHAVFFDVPLEVCIERHQRRDRLVPEDVMRKMAAKLKAPTFDEGFAKITVVRVKQKAEA
jgi:predicted kinase